MYTALTIAGSDSSGGAGIQADIKTMAAHGVYAMSAVTALTAQNTMGVTGIMDVTPDFLKKQLDAVFTDIFPDAVKIGMVSSAGLVLAIAEKLKEYHAVNVIVDPVMIATSGSRLTSDEAVSALTEQLFPIAALITPNIPEAEQLWGQKITSTKEMELAAKTLYEQYGCAVLLKGGHQIQTANDLLCGEDDMTWFDGQHIENPNTHGTGCTLSSAIASNLAKGKDLKTAVGEAKDYISLALADGLNLGHGSGPLNHMFAVRGEYRKES
jgi:hydroxymethylpyrimidine/phosphomethylpyrimidine kinase